MSSSLIRGKYVICKVTSRDSADVVSNGAVYQQDAVIVEVGRYDDLNEAPYKELKAVLDRPYNAGRRSAVR